MKKIVLYTFVFLSTISAYAIDPLGSRVDNGDDGVNSVGFPIFVLIILLLGWGFIKYINYSADKDIEASQPKSNTRSTSHRQWEEEIPKKEESSNGCLIAVIVFVVFILYCIIND